VNASPFAAISCGFAAVGAGCAVEFTRPTPTEFVVGGTRKSSAAVPPAGPTRNTRPWFVPPSEAYRFPAPSNVRPFAPGVPVAKIVAVGGAVGSGASTAIWSPAVPAPVMYSRPSGPKVSPLGLHGGATLPTTTGVWPAPPEESKRHTGHPAAPPRAAT